MAKKINLLILGINIMENTLIDPIILLITLAVIDFIEVNEIIKFIVMIIVGVYTLVKLYYLIKNKGK